MIGWTHTILLKLANGVPPGRLGGSGPRLGRPAPRPAAAAPPPAPMPGGGPPGAGSMLRRLRPGPGRLDASPPRPLPRGVAGALATGPPIAAFWNASLSSDTPLDGPGNDWG